MRLLVGGVFCCCLLLTAGGCGLAIPPDELGEVIYEIPQVPGADKPIDLSKAGPMPDNPRGPRPF